MQGVIFAILAVAVVLILVSLILPWSERRSIPSTLVLASLGIVLGLLAVGAPSEWRLMPVGEALAAIGDTGFSAEVFIYVFLPPLLFTAGLTIDVRLLIDEIGAVLLLAIVAVIVCTLVVGYSLAWATDIGLVACLLLGSIIATTDPAAVIGLFRDLGAPRRLTTLLAGESVLNDAAAIAIFTMLLSMLANGTPFDMAASSATLLRSFIGGIIFGYLASRLTCALLHRLRNTRVAEITVTVGLAYLVFILGEHYLQVSGVVAVVAAALTFAVYGRTRLAPGTWEPLVQTWHQLEFWANSLIFVLAAMFAARAVMDADLSDILHVAIVAVGALAARAVVLYGLLPVLSMLRATQPVGNRYKTVILWGGLRGAITLTLALAIFQLPDVEPETRHFILTTATGFVLFTLFVQATTLKPLMRVLGLDQLSPAELVLRDRVVALSRTSIREQVATVAKEYGFDPSLTDEVIPASDNEPASAEADLSHGERLQVGLLALANRERELYLQHFNEGTMSRQMVARMVADADRLIDAVKTSGRDGYRAATGIAVRPPLMLRMALRIHRYTGWSRPLAYRLGVRFERLIIAQLVVRELARFVRRAIGPLLGQDIGNELSDVIRTRLDSIMSAIEAVELQYPRYAESLRRSYLARAAIRLESAEYRRHFREALIGREIFSDLERDLERRRVHIDRGARLDLGLRLKEMLTRAPLFSELDDDELHQVARCLKPHLAVPGEHIVRRGMGGTAMFFIVSGKVEVPLGSESVELKSGEFFGELALLTGQPRTADVISRGYCQLLVLERRDFRLLVKTIPALRDRIEEVAESRIGENVKGGTDHQGPGPASP